LRKSALDLTINVARSVSLNPYSIKQKREYLKRYENGIALLYPNLEFSYAYPMNDEHAKEIEHFLDMNYDVREYKLVNCVGSLLPLFSFWCPHTKQVYASREYCYLYQNEEKRPFYFLFKFNSSSDSTTDVDWFEGDSEIINKVIGDDKIYIHVANITHLSDPKDEPRSKLSRASPQSHVKVDLDPEQTR
jgi:hypothetical protein